jgi:hypothetical protein
VENFASFLAREICELFCELFYDQAKLALRANEKFRELAARVLLDRQNSRCELAKFFVCSRKLGVLALRVFLLVFRHPTYMFYEPYFADDAIRERKQNK